MSANTGPGGIAVQAITDVKRFAALQPQWNDLCDGVPFRTFEWNYTWWRHFGAGRSLLLLAVYDANVCIGIAPFFVERSLTLGRIVQFLGAGEVASDQQTILAAAGRGHEVALAVAEWFAARNGRGASDQIDASAGNDTGDLLQLDGIDAGCQTFSAFTAGLEQLRFGILDRSTVQTWRIALPTSMDEYLTKLSKPSRRKVRTALKQFDAGQFTISFASDEASFEQNWSNFTMLHQRRRNSLGQSGCFANETFASFLYDVARQFHQRGLLDLVSVKADGRPIAAEICFRNQTSSFAYQIGIDPDALEHNPGWLVNTASIRRAIESGLTNFDLCRGDAEYKRHLGAAPTVCKKLRIVPPRLRSQVLNLAMTTGAAMKNWCHGKLPGTAQ